MGWREVEKREKYQDLMFELRALHLASRNRKEVDVLIVGVIGGMKQSCIKESESITACSANCTVMACRLHKAVILDSLRGE
jgi:hypothetical protein